MKKRRSKHYIEIFPAAMLPQRSAWQTLADNLPEGAWLLILPGSGSGIYQVWFDLIRFLEEKGKQVVLCATDTERNASDSSE